MTSFVVPVVTEGLRWLRARAVLLVWGIVGGAASLRGTGIALGYMEILTCDLVAG